jgi:hypothetical protein
MGGELKVLGAAEHNLRDVDVTPQVTPGAVHTGPPRFSPFIPIANNPLQA